MWQHPDSSDPGTAVKCRGKVKHVSDSDGTTVREPAGNPRRCQPTLKSLLQSEPTFCWCPGGVARSNLGQQKGFRDQTCRPVEPTPRVQIPAKELNAPPMGAI